MSHPELKPVRYHLEIYAPYDDRHPHMSFSAGQPFQAVSVGDIIKPYPEGDQLKVVRIEHLLWERDEHVSHKVMVMTIVDKSAPE